MYTVHFEFIINGTASIAILISLGSLYFSFNIYSKSDSERRKGFHLSCLSKLYKLHIEINKFTYDNSNLLLKEKGGKSKAEKLFLYEISQHIGILQELLSSMEKDFKKYEDTNKLYKMEELLNLDHYINKIKIEFENKSEVMKEDWNKYKNRFNKVSH